MAELCNAHVAAIKTSLICLCALGALGPGQKKRLAKELMACVLRDWTLAIWPWDWQTHTHTHLRAGQDVRILRGMLS